MEGMIRAGMRKAVREAKSVIEAGLPEDVVAQSTRWGMDDRTGLSVYIGHGKMVLEAWACNMMIASVSRRAARPGLRPVDVEVLDRFVKEGPAMIIKSMSAASADAFYWTTLR